MTSVQNSLSLEAPDDYEKLVRVVPYMTGAHVYQMRSVEYLTELTLDCFTSRVRNQHPIVITGMASKWPAMEKWASLQYIANLAGEKKIFLMQAKDNLHFFKNQISHHYHIPGREVAILTLSSEMSRELPEHLVVNNASADTRWYARGEFRNRYLPDIIVPYELLLRSLPDCSTMSKLQLPFKKNDCAVWFSTAGNITPLHFDLCHGLLCQVIGTKKIIMYHKDDYREMYQNSFTHPNITASQLTNLNSYLAGDMVGTRPWISFNIVFNCLKRFAFA